MDLIIVKCLDGLQVHGVSYPPTQIPHWNRKIPNFLTVMISFSAAYLHDVVYSYYSILMAQM
jgi:hypothetical protein